MQAGLGVTACGSSAVRFFNHQIICKPLFEKGNMKIKANSYYVLADHPGISGFKDWNRKVESICTGHKARNTRSLVVREYLATGLGQFRILDGHLPEYCPVVSEVEMLRWLDANPFQVAVEVPQITLAPQPAPSFSNRACIECGEWSASGGPRCEDCEEENC